MLNLLDPDTKPTLLVVDDTPENLSLLSALLSPHYRVKVAISGQRALEILSAGTRVDLILLDVVMPEMDGPTLLGELRKRNPNTKVVFVSGYAEETFSETQARIPNSVFLPKPFSLSELTATVQGQIH